MELAKTLAIQDECEDVGTAIREKVEQIPSNVTAANKHIVNSGS